MPVRERTIYLPDGRVGGLALVDEGDTKTKWSLALFNRSTWLGRGEDDEPYTDDQRVFLVMWDGYRYTVMQTVATMLNEECAVPAI